jgi:RNA polymerase sigma factor (sigma-70 family)
MKVINIPNTTQEEDIEAIKKCLEGDSSGFNYLQKKYKSIVTSLVRRMIKNEEDVEDITQETFIKAYNALASFQFGYSFSAWLYRIASNNCIDFLRKKRFQIISLNVKSHDSDEEEEMEIIDNSYMPDIKVLNDEKKKTLNEAFEKLPTNYKQILKLRHEEDLDYSEIAEKLNIPIGTVKAHLFRARKLMYDHLKANKHLFV